MNSQYVLIFVGSYDHTVKMFDTRLPNSVFSVDHGHPVESVLMFPNGGIFLSAGIIPSWYPGAICEI